MTNTPQQERTRTLPHLAPFTWDKPISIERAANGGWIISTSREPGMMGDLSVFSTFGEMLDALADSAPPEPASPPVPEPPPFKKGAHVLHHPSGENWIVLRSGWDSEGGYVEPAGWPACRARASDCTLIETADDRPAGKKVLNAPEASDEVAGHTDQDEHPRARKERG